MKKLSEIAQLPVLEILNGKIVGKVRDIVINPDTKQALMIMDEGVFSDFNVLQKEDVQGIGKDFIMIKTKAAIQSSRENPELAKALTEYYSIMGLTVITTGGDIVGKIEDVSIDKESWKIVEIVLENGKVYQQNQLLSMSEKFVFVQSSDENDYEQSIIESDVQSDQEENSENAESIENNKKLSEEEYLIGMILKGSIVDKYGNIIIEDGTTISQEIIDIARDRNCMAELIMKAE